MKYYKASNKRLIARASSGKFKKTTLEDIGLNVCSCGHFMALTYLGRDVEFLNPMQFFYVCSSCGHLRSRSGQEMVEGDISYTWLEEYKQREASKPLVKQNSMSEMFKRIADDFEKGS